MRRLTILLVATAVVVSGCGGDTETDELPAVLDQWTEAVMAGDAAAIAALYTEDGVWHDDAIPQTFQGRTRIAGGVGAGIRYLTLSDMELLSAERSGDTMTIEWRWTGTSSDHSRDADDQTPFTAEVEFVFTLDGDLIDRSDFFYDHSEVVN